VAAVSPPRLALAEIRSANDPRAFALEALLRVADGAFSDAVVGDGLAQTNLSGKDRALATRLVYGTLAWQGFLDHILAAYSSRPLDGIDPPVRTLLRLALFQICRLERVPAFAAVNTAVDLCKQHDRRAAGFVNALLRKAATGWEQLPLPDPATNLAAHFAVAFSHPVWLVERWLRDLGEAETRALLAANNDVAPTVARANAYRCERSTLLQRWRDAGVDAAATRYSPAGVQLEAGTALPRLPGFAEGWFAFQGESSQLVAQLVGAQPGERVLDVCAAPGGKTCHLAELMENRGSVVALDIAEPGVARLRRDAERLGLTIIQARVADGSRWLPDAGAGAFDRVLVDAPCTGLGTLRQHPEIRWRRVAADVNRNAALQRRLLQHAASLVRPGGTLVYATCTLIREENEDAVRDLCATAPFRIETAAAHLDEAAAGLVDASGFLRTYPHRHDLDGFFAARLLRVEPASSVRP